MSFLPKIDKKKARQRSDSGSQSPNSSAYPRRGMQGTELVNTGYQARSSFKSGLGSEPRTPLYGAGGKVQPSEKLGKIELEHQDEKDIMAMQSQNALEKTQFDTTEEYINKLRFSIELDNLYKVYDSCCSNTESLYCPVIVKVGRDFIDDQRFDYSYLLQVWSRAGKLLFERTLQKPLDNWNLHGSHFVFQEATDLDFAGQIYLLELSQTEECILYDFKLPAQAFENNGNPHQKVDQLQKLRQGLQKRLKHELPSQTKVMPDSKKIRRRIGIARDNLLVLKDNLIYYISLDDVKGLTQRRLQANMSFFSIEDGCSLMDIMDIGNNETVLTLTNEHLKLCFYQIKAFGQFDTQGNRVDVQLVKLGLIDHDIKQKTVKKNGVKVPYEETPLAVPVQMRAIIQLDHKKVYQNDKQDDSEDVQMGEFVIPKPEKFTSSMVVVRADGSFEFYSDFNLVSTSRSEQEELFCSRIEVDNESYYLLINKASEADKYTLYEFSLSWGNLLGMSVATKLFQANLIADMEQKLNTSRPTGKLDRIQNELKIKQAVQKEFNDQIDMRLLSANHRRVSPFFRIFTQFFNYGTCMLVAHREYVSVFDLKSEGKVDIHIKYNDQVVLLADSTIKVPFADNTSSRNDLAERVDKNISVLLGNNLVYHIKESDGEIVQTLEPQVRIENKIIQHCTDQSKDTAIYFLTQVDHFDYKTFREDGVNRYRMEEPRSTSDKFELIALRGTNISVLCDSDRFVLTAETTIKVFYKGMTDATLQTSLMVSASCHGYSIPIKAIDEEDNIIEVYEDRIQDFTSTLILRSEDEAATAELMQKLKPLDYLPGRLIGCVTCEGEGYHARNGFLAQITTEGIEVYDQNQKLVEWYTNPNIQELVLVDETYLYCLCEAYVEPIKKYDFKKQIVSRPRGASISNQAKGLYVYDIQRLLKEGYIECYFLAPAVVGMAHQLDFSAQSGRLSYFTNFREISMLPFPHRNTINFLGMGDKSEYLIWREKDGFFTGLHRSGQLRVWSVGSGKFIGIKSLTDMPEKQRNTKVKVKVVNEDYEIYQAHDEDTCWTRGFQNQRNHSIQLMKKKQPEHNPDRNDKIENKNFKSMVGHSVETIVQERETYEFLVLKMTTCFDKYKKKTDRQANIKKSDKDKSLQVKVIMRFMFALPKEGKRPTLHLSKNLKKMMEVVDRQVAVIHKIDKKESGTTDWKKKHLISQYPTLLQGTSTLPFLFCPNFERYIDVDFAKGNFVIRHTDSTVKDIIEIPKSLLGLSVVTESDVPETQNKPDQQKKELVIQNEDSIAFLAKRMHFCKKQIIRIINTEGIDTYYDLRSMQIVTYAKRDNLGIMQQPLKSTKHFILEKQEYEVDDLLSRLVHRSQTYKAGLEFAKYELKCRQALQKDYRKPNLLGYLYKVEYQNDNFVAEASFTLLDWIICDRIQRDSLFDFNDIDRQQQIQLCFNIFPKCQTILHKLALASEVNSDSSESMESIGTIAQKLFSVCKKGLPTEYKDFKKLEPFELPIVEDLRGHTVLDIALMRHGDYKQMNATQRFWDFWNLVFDSEDTIFTRSDNLFYRSSKYIYQFIKPPAVQMPMLNSQLAMTIFANISNYGYLHSSCIIFPAVVEAIRIGLPNIGEYLDCRLVTSQHLPNRTQHDLRVQTQEYWHTGDRYCDEEDAGDENKWLCQKYNTVNAQLWEKKTSLEASLFKKSGVHKNMIIRYLDVPSLHTKSDEGVKFIKAMRGLSNVAQEIQLNIYSKRSVQILINEHWRRTYRYIIAFLFAPYVAMLILYSLWSNFTIQGTSDWAHDAGGSFQTILFFMSVYFLVFEVIQFVTNPVSYLMEGWSYIKTLPMILVMINTQQADISHADLGFWQRQAFAGFFMWFRLLYFMRSIEHFSYFIRMLLFVMWKIRIFLIILSIAVLGFADTFYSLSTSTKYLADREVDDQGEVVSAEYITSYVNSLQYSYEIVIGQFADELNDQDSLSWFFFVLASILSMLILANLLIEIVSETYGEVTEKKYLYVFKERVDLINDWQSDLMVINAISYCFWFILKPFFWCLKKMEFIKRNKQQMKRELNEMKERCKMLMVAWEDPENKDETNDVVEDENEETTDEKIDTVQMSITDMKIQLGLNPEIQDEYENSDVNPLTQIQLISDKLERVIGALGLSFDNQGYAQQCEVHPQMQRFVQDTDSGKVQKSATRSQRSTGMGAIKYKQDETFEWQAKRK